MEITAAAFHGFQIQRPIQKSKNVQKEQDGPVGRNGRRVRVHATEAFHNNWDVVYRLMDAEENQDDSKYAICRWVDAESSWQEIENRFHFTSIKVFIYFLCQFPLIR